MKQSISKLALGYVCLAALTLASCVKDEPNKPEPPKPTPKPTPETPVDPGKEDPKPGNKLEVTFRPHKIKLDFYEGHLHNTKDFHYVAGPKEAKHARLEQSLTYVWDEASKSYKVEGGGRKGFLVQQSVVYKNGKQDSPPSPVYGLWIDYFDKDGNKINDKIGAEGAYDQFQHFFLAENVKPAFKGKAEADDSDYSKLIKYIYRDTTPWDKTIKDGAEVIEETSPLGLKGFFSFHKDRKKFDMKVQLWQMPKGVKTEGGGVSPFHAPSAAIKSKGAQVFELTIPITIYCKKSDVDELIPEEATTPFSSFSKEVQEIIEIIAEAFGISKEDVISDFYWISEGQRDENGGRWF